MSNYKIQVRVNEQDEKIDKKLKKALDNFFESVDCAEGCILRKNWDGAPYALIIEESFLYDFLSGEYGWDVHTKFYNAFKETDYHPEMMNSCVVGFYED